MSPTERRRLLAIAAAAFALRVGTAVLTEFKPIFPGYYYADATLADRAARGLVANASEHALPQRAHFALTAACYALVGPRPLAPKLLNALLAAAGVFAFGVLASRIAGPGPGFAAAAALAVWPSHVFYTSQNFKEGAVCGLLMGSLALLSSPRATRAAAAGGATALAALFALRPPVALAAAAALLLASVARARPRVFTALAAASVVAALAAAEPARLDEWRSTRVNSERSFAAGPLGGGGREIGTLLFPDQRFESRLDVALFLPKAALTAAFQPLPGLYPLEGKTGRILAAAENALLLLLVLAALPAATHASGPGRAEALLFAAMMATAAAFTEFDLGSAGRHKLMHLPLLLPFAMETLRRKT